MKQAAEFLGARRQATEADATHRGRVVGQDGHRDLYLSPVPPFVTQLGRTPAEQAGDDTFDHRAALACHAGQLPLAGGTVAVQTRDGEYRVNLRGGRCGRERLDRARDTNSEDALSMQGLP